MIGMCFLAAIGMIGISEQLTNCMEVLDFCVVLLHIVIFLHEEVDLMENSL